MQQILDLIFLNNEEQNTTNPPRPSPLIYLYQPENHKNLHYFFYYLTPLTKSN